MQSVVLTGIRTLEVRDEPKPELQRDSDVLLHIDMVGICGSDVHYYTTGRIGSQVVQYPYRVGHECAGTVEAVGAAVTQLKPGDRVALEPAVSCSACDQCRMGRPHTCRELKFLGCPGQLEGCMCEYLVMPETCCFPLADDMTLERAVLAEPLAIGVYAVLQSLPMEGARIAITGCGPIGLSCLAAARAEGAQAIYCTDRIDVRCAAARGFGAVWAGNPDQENVVAAIQQAEPGGVDVVFECAGQQETVDQAIDLLRPGGKLMIIGIPEFDRYAFSADVARRKEICIQHVRRQNHCTRKTLDWLAEGRLEADAMVTHHFPLVESKAGFDLVDQYADGVIKAMITL